MTKIITAAFAACLFVGGASVQAEMREPVTIKIHHADLNLARADHRAVMARRIRLAAYNACGPITTDMVRNVDVQRCRQEIRADAAAKLAALPAATVALASNR